jgi:DNA polymerase III epsilon subunit-like protein
MLLCFIDFEATGLDTNKERITELGAILYNTQNSSVLAIGCLVYEKDYPPLSQEVIDVTGITDRDLQTEGLEFWRMFEMIFNRFQQIGFPEYFVAHNKSFDENLFKMEMKRHKDDLVAFFGDDAQKVFDIPWLCTIEDLEHPKKFKCKKLSHLALDYGVIVDPSKLHRAVDDVQLLIRMTEKAGIDWEQVVERSKIPWVVVRAKVPKPWDDAGVGKDKAKSCGFGWQQPFGSTQVYENMWVKRIKQTEIQKETDALGYELVILA